MMKLINGMKDFQLRSILLMSIYGQPLSIDEMAVMDFITTYSKLFKLGDKNLHGDSDFSFAEYPKRRRLLTEANNTNYIDGMVELCYDKDCFKYVLTSKGESLAVSLDTEYAHEYKVHLTACIDDIMEKENWFQSYLMCIMKGRIS